MPSWHSASFIEFDNYSQSIVSKPQVSRRACVCRLRYRYHRSFQQRYCVRTDFESQPTSTWDRFPSCRGCRISGIDALITKSTMPIIAFHVPVLRYPRTPAADARWRHHAACGYYGPALFFGLDGEPTGDRIQRERRAKAICDSCPVRVPCYEFALDADEKFGIWGGTTARERRSIANTARKTAIS